MRGKLLDISDKIDPFNLYILKSVEKIAGSLGLEFFVVGAAALDMTLNLYYGIKTNRKTNDVDFCIRIGKWEDYDKLNKALINNGFKEDNNIIHRFYYNGFPIDLIPFGNIVKEDNTIEWPDKNRKEISVIGIEEAYNNSEIILIQKNPEIQVKFSSLPGLVLLKLIAWKDNLDRRIKDAGDIYYIITQYLGAGNHDRIFEKQTHLFEEEGDYELAGARLLGRDLRSIANVETINIILRILESEKDFDSLTSDMFRSDAINIDYDTKYLKITSLLNSLMRGIKD